MFKITNIRISLCFVVTVGWKKVKKKINNFTIPKIKQYSFTIMGGGASGNNNGGYSTGGGGEKYKKNYKIILLFKTANTVLKGSSGNE